MPRRMSRGSAAVTAVVATAVLAVGCSSSAEPVPADELPVGDAFSSVVAASGNRTTWEADIALGTVLMAGMDRLDVGEAVVVEEVTPLRAGAGIEVVQVVASFMRREDQLVNAAFLGSKCMGDWPHPRLAERGAPVHPDPSLDDPVLYPVEGLELYPGDQVAFALVSRPTRAGTWSAEGLRIVYRHDGRRYQEQTEIGKVVHEAGTEGGCDGS